MPAAIDAVLPCSFYPILPNRVWRSYQGGRILDELNGAAEPADSHFPEDWILSDTFAVNPGREPEGVSLLERQGRPVRFTDLVAAEPERILGPEHCRTFGLRAGFLLKFLDSAVRLQLQCHPTAAFSRQHLNANAGKTEGYVILGHRPDVQPILYLGFQHPVDPKEFRRAVAMQDREAMLRGFDPIPVRRGDVFLVPGGLPHAIGAGIFMIEIMEPTDFVARLEFECGGYTLPEAARFMGRGLDFGLSMLDFTPRSVAENRERFFLRPVPADRQPGGERQALFHPGNTPCFRGDGLRVDGTLTVATDSFAVLIVTGGEGRIEADGEERKLRYGDRLFLPFATRSFQLRGRLEAFLARPPAVP